MNNATEQMLGARLNPQQQMYASLAALRNAWLARPGDVIVSSRPLGAEFEDYVCETLGLPPRSLDVLCTEPTGGRAVTVNDDSLLSAPMVEALRGRIRQPEHWRMWPCYQTEGTARLVARLGLPDSVGRRFAAERGTDLLNRKSHFRQLAIGAALPIAKGAVVHSPRTLGEAIDRFRGETGMVMLKRDNGAGGTGNIVLAAEEAGPQPGAFETITLGPNVATMAESLWSQLATERDDRLVVEVYEAAEHMFYVEFHIDDDATIEFLASGSIRLRRHEDPTAKHLFWVGLEIPARTPPAILESAVVSAARFARLAADIGYRGHINIDAIVTAGGALLFNEANARWGGGTVLHSVAEALLGPRYGDAHVVTSFREVRVANLAASLRALDASRLRFDARRREGIVVLASDECFTHSIEALVIAGTRDRLRELETELLEATRLTQGAAA